MEFNPTNILRDYNTSIGNITLLEYNPKNFRVIFQNRVKFPFFENFRVKFQKCYFPKVLYSHASMNISERWQQRKRRLKWKVIRIFLKDLKEKEVFFYYKMKLIFHLKGSHLVRRKKV